MSLSSLLVLKDSDPQNPSVVSIVGAYGAGFGVQGAYLGPLKGPGRINRNDN